MVELLLDTTAEEEHMLYLNQLYETHWDVELALEAHKRRVKAQYDKKVNPCSYQEGDIVLLDDKKHDLLGEEHFNTCGSVHMSSRKPSQKGIWTLGLGRSPARWVLKWALFEKVLCIVLH